MDSFESPHMSQITECTDDLPFRDIESTIKQLSNSDNNIRMEARDVLSCIGAPAVPGLLNALKDANTHLRWQIIKIFDTIQDPSTIPILMDHLKDDNSEIRWAASNALITLQREAIPPLLTALTHDFDSLWLRQSAHHILRAIRDRGNLTPAEEKVLKALEDSEPAVSVPWVAAKALEALEIKKRNLLH